jgi:hypothetical protein
MDSRGVTLTLGTTLRFGSLGFVYTGPVEPVAERMFAQPPGCTPVDSPASRTTR